jgi:hypothetical protein
MSVVLPRAQHGTYSYMKTQRGLSVTIGDWRGSLGPGAAEVRNLT